ADGVAARDLLQLAEYPLRRIGRQLGQVREELLDVGARDARPEVVADELVIAPRDPLGEEPAASERREDESLHGPEAASAREVARDLVPFVVERREHRAGIDAHLLPDAEERREEALRVPIDERARALEREVLQLGQLGRAEAGNAAVDVLDAVGV